MLKNYINTYISTENIFNKLPNLEIQIFVLFTQYIICMLVLVSGIEPEPCPNETQQLYCYFTVVRY